MYNTLINLAQKYRLDIFVVDFARLVNEFDKNRHKLAYIKLAIRNKMIRYHFRDCLVGKPEKNYSKINLYFRPQSFLLKIK